MGGEDEGSGEQGGGKDKRHFTHGTQSERTAKKCGGLHCVLTWVIGLKIHI